jgi:hypothetical protein
MGKKVPKYFEKLSMNGDGLPEKAFKYDSFKPT